MILIIDNYDSFVFNLAHYIHMAGAQVRVVRNDALSVDEALAMGADGIVLSPGPGRPEDAGICVEVARRAGDIPVLGVCLGHQAIGAAMGGKIVSAREIVHGKVSPITTQRTSVFSGLPKGFGVTRYHSLAIDRDTLPDVLRVTAETQDGEIMGVAHTQRPVHGVQFHPESIASDHGHGLIEAFVDMTRAMGNAGAPASSPAPGSV